MHEGMGRERESEVAASRDLHSPIAKLCLGRPVEQVESVRSALLRTAFGIC